MKKLFSVFIISLALGFHTNAQTNPMRVGGQVGIAIPIGDVSNSFSTGFNINGLFIYHLQPQLDLTGQLGYIRLGSKESGIDASWSTVPLLAGARYSFAGTSSFTPYVGAELGLFFSSSTATVTVSGFEGFGGGTYSASASSTNFGFVPQVGFTYPITPALLLDANLKFNLILTSGSSSNIFGINAGLTYGL